MNRFLRIRSDGRCAVAFTIAAIVSGMAVLTTTPAKAQADAAALAAQLQQERREHAQALQRAERARTTWQITGLFGMLTLGAITAATIVSRRRLKLRAERRLAEETRAASEIAARAAAFNARLVRIASHDLKTPLAALIGGAEMLEQDASNAAQVTEVARLMACEARQMLTLLRDVVDAASLQRGGLQLTKTPVGVSMLVRESVASLAPRARARSQALTCDIDSAVERARVSGDALRLRQVFDNLLDHAIRTTPAGKPVQVRASVAAGAVRVLVHDSGPGLTPDDYARLFQPFDAWSDGAANGDTSLGLGVTLARELIALHGGQMIVDSEPGRGAVLGFELPVLSDEEPTNPPPSANE